MGIRVTTTHSFSGLIKFVYFIVNLFILAFTISFAESIFGNNLVTGITAFFSIVLSGYYTADFFQNLGVYLYCRISLKTNITWKEADYVAPLFLENGTGKWYPMKHIRDVSPIKRKKELLEQASLIFKNNPNI